MAASLSSPARSSPTTTRVVDPSETFATAAWAGGATCRGGAHVACPHVAAGGGGGRKKGGAAAAAGQCALHCPLQLPDRPGDIKLPVPLCKGKTGGAPRCPAFYNNFEVVDMRAFRTPRQWEFFLMAEASHAFLCEAYPQRSRPNKCGGGGAAGRRPFRRLFSGRDAGPL